MPVIQPYSKRIVPLRHAVSLLLIFMPLSEKKYPCDSKIRRYQRLFMAAVGAVMEAVV